MKNAVLDLQQYGDQTNYNHDMFYAEVPFF